MSLLVHINHQKRFTGGQKITFSTFVSVTSLVFVLLFLPCSEDKVVYWGIFAILVVNPTSRVCLFSVVRQQASSDRQLKLNASFIVVLRCQTQATHVNAGRHCQWVSCRCRSVGAHNLHHIITLDKREPSEQCGVQLIYEWINSRTGRWRRTISRSPKSNMKSFWKI